MASEEEAMAYSRGAVERAMKVQEVLLRAIDGKLTWVQAADILGYSPRTIRRIRWRLQHYGYDGLLDRRRQTPSPKRAPVAEVQRLLALYRERYLGFNVRHFHQLARREHGVRFCYAFVTKALQTAGLVAKHQPRPEVGRRGAGWGIEPSRVYSPGAGGRSERPNRPRKDRLVNELRAAGITTVAAANRYVRARFLPAFNAEFGRPPADPASAFVPPGRVDLDQILCVEDERMVGRDNVVTADHVPLQLAKQPGRRTSAALRVLVRRHLSGQHSVWYGGRCLRRSDPTRPPLPAARPVPLIQRPTHRVKKRPPSHPSAT